MMWRRGRKFLALPPAVRWEMVRAGCLLALAPAGLRLWGFTRFYGWVIGRGGGNPAGDLAGVMQQAQPFALAAAAVPWPTTCLSRSLALCWFLRRQGVAAEVQLGVRPRPGGLEAHAWVVWQGAVLNDSPDVAQRYAVLDQLNEQIHLPHTN